MVAPEAELKVYLTADPAERARRRAAELGGEQAIVMAEQALRDERDSTRAHSPLQAAPGAVVLDTTGMASSRSWSASRRCIASQVPESATNARPIRRPS